MTPALEKLAGRRPGLLARLLVMCLLAFASTSKAAVHVEASVDDETVGLEELLRYTVTVRDTTLGRVQTPGLPPLDDFEIVTGPSLHRYFEFRNGRSVASVSWTWGLQPLRTGQFVLEPTEVVYDGEEYQTNRIRVTVEEGGGSRSGSSRRDRWGRRRPEHVVRIVTDLEKTGAWVGETIVLTYRLQSTLRLLEAQATEAPEFPGFLVHDDDPPDRGRRAGEEDGRPLYEHELARYVLIPLDPGRKGIPALKFQLKFRVPDDGFGLPMFSRTEQMVRTAPSRVVEVESLPRSGMPSDYAGAVGRYSLEASISGNQGHVGEALSLRLILSGAGNFPQVGPPELAELGPFRVFEPEAQADIAVSARGLTGRKVWEYVLVPREPGSLEIPEIRFPYFDPEAASYRVSTTRPLRLTASGEASGTGARSGEDGGGRRASGDGGPQPRAAFLLMHLDGDALAPPWRPWRRWWFAALAGLPLLWILGAVLARARESSRSAREDRRRIRRARANAQARLRTARQRIHHDGPFYGEVSSALLGYVADKSGRGGVRGLDRGRALRRLRRAGVDEEVLAELGEILAHCEEGRYSPEPTADEAKKELLRRARKMLDRLEKERLAKKLTRAAAVLVAILLLAPSAAAAGPETPTQTTTAGGTVEELSAQAAEAYAEGRHGEAMEIYRLLLGEAPHAAALHHNLGVVLHRNGERGEAVLHLERALRLDPSLEVTRASLEEIRNEIAEDAGASPPPWQGIVDRLRALVPPGPAAMTALVLWWIVAFTVVLALRDARPGRRLWRAVSLGLGAVLLFLVVGFAGHLWWAEIGPGAVVLDPADLRTGPADSFPILGSAPEGEVVYALRRRDGWVQLRLDSGLTGWVPGAVVGEI